MNQVEDRSVGEMLRLLYQTLPKGVYAHINFGRTTKNQPSKVYVSANFPEGLPIYVRGDTIVMAVNALIKAIEERS